MGNARDRHKSYADYSPVWLTPPHVLAALGPFDLDPCAAPEPRPWSTACVHYALPQNGLALPWHGRVWCNPPFGKAADPWLFWCWQHGDAVALVPAAVETKRWQAFVWGCADAVLFIRGRLRFCTPTGAPADSFPGSAIALIAYGVANAAALRASGLGHVVDAGAHD